MDWANQIQNLIPLENIPLKEECMDRKKAIKPAAEGLRKNASDSETEDIRRDPIAMKLLESADRQYLDGKAIPLSKLLSDLGFEEDEL